MLFLSVRGFLDYAGPTGHSRLSRPTVLPSPLRQKVGILKQRFFEAQSPGPPIPLSTLRAPPHDAARKTQGQDGFAVLLSCRALASPSSAADARAEREYLRTAVLLCAHRESHHHHH